MARSILGAIIGYVATFIFMFAACTAAYLAMGADNAFLPGTYKVSMLWIAVSLVLGFIAAVFGGYVAELIGKGPKAVTILVIIVLVMSILMLGAMFGTTEVDLRTADVPNMEAFAKAQTPLWAIIVSVLLSLAGVVTGGKLRKS